MGVFGGVVNMSALLAIGEARGIVTVGTCGEVDSASVVLTWAWLG